MHIQETGQQAHDESVENQARTSCRKKFSQCYRISLYAFECVMVIQYIVNHRTQYKPHYGANHRAPLEMDDRDQSAVVHRGAHASDQAKASKLIGVTACQRKPFHGDIFCHAVSFFSLSKQTRIPVLANTITYGMIGRTYRNKGRETQCNMTK